MSPIERGCLPKEVIASMKRFYLDTKEEIEIAGANVGYKEQELQAAYERYAAMEIIVSDLEKTLRHAKEELEKASNNIRIKRDEVDFAEYELKRKYETEAALKKIIHNYTAFLKNMIKNYFTPDQIPPSASLSPDKEELEEGVSNDETPLE